MILRRCVSAAVTASLWCGSVAPATARAQPAPPQAAGVHVPQDKDERGLWMQADEEERRLKNSNFIVKDAALNAYVRDVFCRTVGPECAPIRIYIVRTPYFNATSAPNGMIQLWSGLFLRTRDEAQLAAVLAHEYIHYRDRHQLQLWRELKSRSGAATFFMMFGIVGGLVALGTLTSLYSFSRDQERAADKGSIAMLAHADYDPLAASRIWGQIRAEQDATAAARNTKSRKDRNGGMFATHPPTAERMASLGELVKAEAPRAPVLRVAEYRAALAPLWANLIDDQIKLNDLGATEFLLASLASDGWTPDLLYARGELYRSRGRAEDFPAAIGYYRQALDRGSAVPEVHRGLGLSLLRMGNDEEGRVALREYLRMKPEAVDKPMIQMLAGGE